MGDLIKQTCASLDAGIINGHVSKDHVHIKVSFPRHLSVSKLARSVNGRTSRRMMEEFRRLKGVFYARGYFAANVGTVVDEVIGK